MSYSEKSRNCTKTFEEYDLDILKDATNEELEKIYECKHAEITAQAAVKDLLFWF